MSTAELELAFRLQGNLTLARLTGWGATPIPNEIDDEITRFLKAYLSLSANEQSTVRDLIGRDQGSIFGVR